MKKIVLGCAALLLSLGLLAGCNNNPSTVDAVIINVDSSASVVVGETLELPYSVEPEKATVVAASDHEEYVTADAQDGILYLHGVAEGSAIVTLVGTYKKYAEANVNINVSVVTEAAEKTEPGTPDTGGDGSGTTEPVAGTVAEGEYWLGFEMSEVDYYFDGTVYNTNYAGVTSDGWDAVIVTVAEASGGYTLSFVDENDATQYLKLAVEDTSVRLRWSETEEFVWIYDTTYETFVAYSSDTPYFICTYGTYKDLCLNDYGYLTGDTETSNAQYPAKLYAPVTYAAPTTDTLVISGGTEVYHNSRLTLTATAGEGEDPRVTWSVAPGSEEYASVTSTGSTTCTVFGNEVGSATIVATSVTDPTVSASIEITINATPEDLPFEVGEEYWIAYEYSGNTYYFDGTISSNYYGSVKTSSASGAFITIEEYNNGYSLRFTDSDGKQQYIYLYGSGNLLDFGIREEKYEFTYDYSLETFVGETEDNTLCYIGNYYKDGTTYNELRAMKVDSYGTEEGTTYCIAEFVAPNETTAITINGVEQLRTGSSTTLIATVAEGEDYRVTWSITSGGDYATIDSNTGVLTAGDTPNQDIVVTATSLKYTDITATHTVTLFEATAGSTEYTISITPESLAAECDKTVSDQADISGHVSTYDEGAITVTWTGGGTGIKPWNSVSTSNSVATIRIYSGAKFTVSSGTGTLEKVVIDAAYSSGNEDKGCGTSFSAEGGTVGTAVTTNLGDQVEITATETNMTISRSGSVCYCSGITIYYLA